MIKNIILKTVLFLILSFPVYSQVTEQWVKRFSQSEFSEESSKKILVDKFNGDIYVTGTTKGNITNSKNDIVVIKYSSAGVEQWKRVYNGDGNGDDLPSDMILDQLGGLIITGYSSGRNSSADFITIKYDLNGNRLWVRKYNGDSNGNDYAESVVTDGMGGIIVTGKSMGTEMDLITLKYSFNGETVWVSRYNGIANKNDGSSSIAVDGNSNVYVNGYTQGGNGYNDLITLKYDSQGVILWTRIIATPFNDAGKNIILNYVSGEIYSVGVSGLNTIVVTYDESGNERWTSSVSLLDNFTKACFDGNHTLYICGSVYNASADIGLVALNTLSAGSVDWRTVYDSPSSGEDLPEDIASDKIGGIYIAAFSSSLTASSEYNTIKFNSAGVQQWEARYNFGGSNNISSIDIGKNNTVFITGRSLNTSGNYDIASIKYSQSAAKIKNEKTQEFVLLQNSPNPFNPSTVIGYNIPSSSYVKICVYNVLGREIAVLVNEYKNEGSYNVSFDASGLASGIYFYRITAGNFTGIKKMTLIK